MRSEYERAQMGPIWALVICRMLWLLLLPLRAVGGQKLGMSSRGSRVDVMETSKDWPGDDRSGGAERTRSGRMQIQT
jgi:hypothetical protein